MRNIFDFGFKIPKSTFRIPHFRSEYFFMSPNSELISPNYLDRQGEQY